METTLLIIKFQLCNKHIYSENINKIKGLIDNVYNHCIKLEQPECQIIWAIFSQPYLSYQRNIEWKEIDAIYEDPTIYLK